MKKRFLILTVLLILTGIVSAETEIESKINVRFDISADFGGVFDGWDADYAGGFISNLYIMPRKKLTLHDIQAYTYKTEIENSGFEGFILPNMQSFSGFDALEKSNSIIQRGRKLADSLNNGEISQEVYDKRTKSLNDESNRLSAEMNAVVVESSFLGLEKFCFGVSSGYLFSSILVEEETRHGTESHFEAFSYIPVMASFQHNFSPTTAKMRHLYTKVVIPYEEKPKTLEWNYRNTQAFLFYKINAGAGIINENEFVSAGYAPLARIEIGIGSYDGFFSPMNMSVGYQHLFGYNGTIYANWCFNMQ